MDYIDARLSEEFTHSLSLRVMKLAAALDLAYLEEENFYDTLDRALGPGYGSRGDADGARVGVPTQHFHDFAGRGGGVGFALLFGLLFVCVLPAFAGENHFAFLGYSLARELTPIRRELDYLRLLVSSRESVKEVKMFALAQYLVSGYRALFRKVAESNRHLTRQRFQWGAMLVGLSAVGYYGGYAFLVFQAYEGRIAIGTLTLLAGTDRGRQQ